MHLPPLKIESVAYGGKGVARHEGKVYFIADALEGDVVRAEVVKDAGRYSDAKIVEVVEPSPYRQIAPCPYAGACGGCTWQHATEEAQRKWKSEAVRSLFKRIAQIELPTEVKFHALPEGFSYRNRVLVRGRLDESGKISFGYFRKGSRDYIPIHDCLIAADGIRKFVRDVVETRSHLQGFTAQFKCELQEVPVGSGKLIITYYPDGKEDAVGKKICDMWRARDDVAWCDFVFHGKHAENFLFDAFENAKFYTRPGSFQQVNISLNHILRRRILEILKTEDPEEVLDLYCGAGNLSALPAILGIPVTGVEISGPSIEVARESFAAQKFNASFIAQSVDEWLKRNKRTWDFIIVDPPREGVAESIKNLAQASNRNLIYVSCDPATLARDMAFLKHEFRISSIEYFDFFPQTYHVETLIHLQKTNIS